MSVSQKVNDAANLCQDPETKGFDLQAGQSWVYPTNYSVRDYQFNIIQQAIHKNTLVSLPTGLGKTFIAAVVMYNFYRWYPHDKIIFMAPTRPLVKQQMDACYNITAIPQEVTAELTGSKVQQSRTEIWHSKRVFFITPQVLQNDLAIIIELGGKIKCLVFDEAHRAKGNHAYCEVIRKLLPTNKLFRVLALSATPGNSSKDVIEVMQNLLIAHVEFRSEESPDVKPYVFERALETVVVPLGEKLQQVKDQYIQILEKYTRTLIKYKVIYGNCSNLTKGKIFMVMKEFQAKNSGSRLRSVYSGVIFTLSNDDINDQNLLFCGTAGMLQLPEHGTIKSNFSWTVTIQTPNYAEIMKSLNICVTLYHAYETLIRCGLRAFLNFYEEHIKNPLLSGNINLRQILEDLRDYLGPSADVHSLPDGSFTEVPASTKFGHPKLYKLRDILLTHFKNSDPSTRVIVFFEYRESASEAHALLTQNYPTLRPRIFVGQGSGVTQKDQINTIKAFRDGNCNTLLSTCIGEEGLDVGDVDLIVCFDIANKSPIRMIQRMGRTGRKKEGRVVVLVTEGREQQTLKDCLIYKNNLGNFVSNSEQLEPGKYQENPKMIPSYIQPKCQKMYITVQKPTSLKKSGNLKNMLKKIASEHTKFREDVEIIEITERIKSKVENLWDKENPLEFNFEKSKINFMKHIEKQRKVQTHGAVKHSKQTDILVSLLQFADSKRFNLPVTQEISKLGIQNRFLKQGDIRSMFSKPIPTTLSQEIYAPSQYLGKEKDVTQLFPPQIFDEISTFLSISMSTKRTCKTCDLLFECPQLGHPESEKIDLSTMVIPDLSVLDGISSKDWTVFADSLSPKSKNIYCDFLEDDLEAFDEITFSELDKTVATKNRSMTYETPRDFDKILKSFRLCEDEEDESANNIEEKSFGFQNPKGFDKVVNLLDNSLEQEFQDDEILPEKSHGSNLTKEITVKTSTFENKNKISSYDEILAFFKLSSLTDVFVDTKQPCSQDSNTTIIYTHGMNPYKSPKNITPDLFDASPDLFPSSEKKTSISSSPESPVLCSYERVVSLQAKKKLFNETKDEEIRKKPRLSNLKLQRKSFFESTRRKSIDFGESPSRVATSLDISDICDVDGFMNTDVLAQKKNEETKLNAISENDNFDDYMKVNMLSEKKEYEGEEINHRDVKKTSYGLSKKEEKDDLDISSLCDLSIFGLSGPSTSKESRTVLETKKIHKVKQSEKSSIEPKKSPIRELKIDDICDLSTFFEPLKSMKSNRAEKDKQAIQANVEDFCDISSFVDPQKNKSIESTTTHVEDFCDMSFFVDTPKKKLNSTTNVGDICEKTPVADAQTKSTATNLNDFCDMSFFMDTPKKKRVESNVTQKFTKKTTKHENNDSAPINEKKAPKETVIDLTDSDLEFSPVKTNQNQVNKPLTQLSITQMLSLVEKSNDLTNSQKENTFSPIAKTQKPDPSLSGKKKILQLKQTVNSPRAQSQKNNDVTPKTKKNRLNIPLPIDSDDEFEDSFKSPVFAKPKPMSSQKKKKETVPNRQENKKRKKLFCQFIEEEADVSLSESVVISEDEDSGEDCFEASFVADETQDDFNTTNMQAKYLQSVKSPVRKGAFKIPEKFKHNITNVFSQEVNNEDNTYLNDTFCVDDEEEVQSDDHDVSELELLEKRLKEMKKDKKRKKSSQQADTKRRRIIVVSDDSD